MTQRSAKSISVMSQICRRVLQDAEDRRTGAGFNGSHSDGGARELERQIEWFKAGVAWAERGTVPVAWKSYEKDVQNRNDPEFARYQELKRKFG